MGYPWKITEILPKVLSAGEQAGVLTEEGAKLLDPSGNLKGGIPVCPPEGDAGTGMVATNSVAVRTGNVSAGTSVFAMIVLEKALENVHTAVSYTHLMNFGKDPFVIRILNTGEIVHSMEELVSIAGEFV